MGLDVCHYKLTLNPDDRNNYLETEGWDASSCNLPLDTFTSYIQDIPSVEFNKYILVIEDKRHLDKIDKGILESAVQVYTGSAIEKVKDKIEEFILSQRLDKLERQYLTCESSGSNSESNCTYQSISFAENTIVQGFYYNEVGYQRKGMSNDFYAKFKGYEFYGKKEDFENALKCVGDEWYIEKWGQEVVNKMREDFRRDFVDSFEFGLSLLYPSF